MAYISSTDFTGVLLSAGIHKLQFDSFSVDHNVLMDLNNGGYDEVIDLIDSDLQKIIHKALKEKIEIMTVEHYRKGKQINVMDIIFDSDSGNAGDDVHKFIGNYKFICNYIYMILGFIDTYRYIYPVIINQDFHPTLYHKLDISTSWINGYFILCRNKIGGQSVVLMHNQFSREIINGTLIKYTGPLILYDDPFLFTISDIFGYRKDRMSMLSEKEIIALLK